MSRLRLGVTTAFLVAIIAFPLGVLASHQFSDVPSTSPYHNDIDAIADVGVTTGCGGGKYCPKDYVTREQMAAFMNRLGALGPGKAPVVNADKVDGLDSTSLMLGTATIRSGTTVTGYEYVSNAGLANDAFMTALVHLPARAPVGLASALVNFAPDTHAEDDDATCTGTVSAPTAPAGKVCIYVDGQAYADNATGDGLAAAASAFGDRAFVVNFQANNPTAGQSVVLSFAWGYTAP
jgi:hypothetical protein